MLPPSTAFLCSSGGLGVYLLATTFRTATTDNAAEPAAATRAAARAASA